MKSKRVKPLFLPDSDEEPAGGGGSRETPESEGIDLSGESYLQDSIVNSDRVPMVRFQVIAIFRFSWDGLLTV